MNTRVLLLLVALLCLGGCAKTEVLNVSVPQLDTIATKAHRPHKPPKDTTETSDTLRVQIGFNPTVADWDELTEKTTL